MKPPNVQGKLAAARNLSYRLTREPPLSLTDLLGDLFMLLHQTGAPAIQLPTFIRDSKDNLVIYDFPKSVYEYQPRRLRIGDAECVVFAMADATDDQLLRIILGWIEMLSRVTLPVGVELQNEAMRDAGHLQK